MKALTVQPSAGGVLCDIVAASERRGIDICWTTEIDIFVINALAATEMISLAAMIVSYPTWHSASRASPMHPL